MMETLVLGFGKGAAIGLLALGIVLVYKATRVLNFAQGEFGTFAAYLAWVGLTRWHLPWSVAALFAIACVIVLALGIERSVVRPMLDGNRVALTVATLGIMSLLGFAELKIWGASPRILPPMVAGRGVRISGVVLDPSRLIALAATAVVAVGLLALLKRTTFGLGVLAASQDPETVRLMGVRLSRISAFTWGTAGALGAAAGLIVLPSIGTFNPFVMTGFFVEALAAALLGGLTSLPGALVGGIGVGILDAAVSRGFSSVPGAVETGILALILLVLLVRPRGLLGREA